MPEPRILLFDSGVGGLSVLRHLRRRLPGAAIDYLADNATYPYGGLPVATLCPRVIDVVGRFIALCQPDLLVIGCNTASTQCLEAIRRNSRIPVIGTVPAIKPAAEVSRTGVIAVLATPQTTAGDYLERLIDTFAGRCRVLRVAERRLADFAEAKLRGTPPDLRKMGAELAPLIAARRRLPIDTVVLGCTHYPLLLPELRRLVPGRMTWLESGPGVARQAARLLPAGRYGIARRGDAWFTAEQTDLDALTPALRHFGLGGPRIDALPIAAAHQA